MKGSQPKAFTINECKEIYESDPHFPAGVFVLGHNVVDHSMNNEIRISEYRSSSSYFLLHCRDKFNFKCRVRVRFGSICNGSLSRGFIRIILSQYPQ